MVEPIDGESNMDGAPTIKERVKCGASWAFTLSASNLIAGVLMRLSGRFPTITPCEKCGGIATKVIISLIVGFVIGFLGAPIMRRNDERTANAIREYKIKQANKIKQ